MSEKNTIPTSYYQPLFDLLHQKHGITPLESEMADVIHVVERMQEKQQGAVWVKASERKPANSNLVHLQYSTAKTLFKLTGFYELSKGEWYRQDCKLLDWAPNLEWLDESGTSATKTEKPILTQSRADFIREVNDRDMEGLEAIEFAEWAPTIAFFDDEYRLWELLKEGEFINGQFRFTTKELYKLFKQQKEKR